MDAPRSPKPGPNAQDPSEMELGPRVPATIFPDEHLDYDLRDEDDAVGTDPEHSRRLAAVRTELLRRSQHRTPSE